MRSQHLLVKMFLCVGVWSALITIDRAAAGQEVKPTLDAAFRAWDMGFSSDQKDERVDALRSMLPRKQEIISLFPEQVDRLWPILEKGHNAMLENVDRLAREITRGGPITTIKPIDVRADATRAEGAYRDVLAMLPQDVDVFELVVSREQSSAGSGTYLRIKDRWFWIRGFDAIPKLLERLR